MSKNSSAEYYQGNKEILQKKYRERYQRLSKKKKNIKRVLWNEKEHLAIIIRNCFHLENLLSFFGLG